MEVQSYVLHNGHQDIPSEASESNSRCFFFKIQQSNIKSFAASLLLMLAMDDQSDTPCMTASISGSLLPKVREMHRNPLICKVQLSTLRPRLACGRVDICAQRTAGAQLNGRPLRSAQLWRPSSFGANLNGSFGSSR